MQDLESIAAKAKSLRRNPGLRVHPWEHTLRVVDYAVMIAKNEFPQFARDSAIAAYYHDVGRQEDIHEPYHGWTSATIFDFQSGLDRNEHDFPSIFFAIRHHADRKAPDGALPVPDNFLVPSYIDTRIAKCLWDADRLDLMRISMFPYVRPELLSTRTARDFANSEAHKMIYSSLGMNP